MTWFLPTLARPERLLQFLQSYSDMEETAKVVVIFSSWDPRLKDYQTVHLPAHFETFVSELHGPNPVMEEAFKRWPNEACYGILNDDVLLRTKKGLSLLEAEAGDRWIAIPSDGHHGHLVTFPCIGGELARAIGQLTPTGVKANGGEEIWMQLLQTFPIGRRRKDVLLEHMHFLFKKSEKDFTYEQGELNSQDFQTRVYEFMDAHFPSILERVRALYV